MPLTPDQIKELAKDFRRLGQPRPIRPIPLPQRGRFSTPEVDARSETVYETGQTTPPNQC